MNDPYQILGVSENASDEEIKSISGPGPEVPPG